MIARNPESSVILKATRGSIRVSSPSLPLPALLCVGRGQYGVAGGRPLRPGERRPGPFRGRRPLWGRRGGGEPPIQVLAAAVAGRRLLLRSAFGAIGRAIQSDVKMIVVPPVGPHLVHPVAIRVSVAA